MARLNATWWQRKKYLLHAIVLALPVWFIYQSLNPQFPALWQEQQAGEFKIAPMPLNEDAPYSHHNEYVKDFFIAFNVDYLNHKGACVISNNPSGGI